MSSDDKSNNQAIRSLAKRDVRYARPSSAIAGQSSAEGIPLCRSMNSLPINPQSEIRNPKSADTIQAQFQQQLAALRNDYQQKLPKKIRDIEDIWAQLQKRKWEGQTLKILHRMTHSLSGAAGTFDLVEVSRAARCLERYLESLLENTGAPTETAYDEIDVLLASLKQVAGKSAPTPVTHEADTPSPVGVATPSKKLERPCSARNQRNERLIFLVEDDPHLAKDIELQISHFGYTVRSFQELSVLKATFSEAEPAAIIMDIIFPEGRLAGAQVVAEIQQAREVPIPAVFISARDDLTARLEVVRARGDAYFTKPVDVSKLIDKLDELTVIEPPEPYRILIVEDESTSADYYELILQQAGMNTMSVTDPMEVMQPLIDFRPDLILMDLYMPGCDGLELAKVLRQQEAYVSIPIVFLSTETDAQKQLEAMRLGGDDFLNKSLDSEQLISSVTFRAERARVLRSFIDRDSLTGLFNHTKIKEQLDIEVSRAERQDSPLSCAMLDLDHFKSVNDTYGHAAGNRVLKSLSRILQQRLRKTDIIGRYGGEEFAVLLPNTDGHAAVKVLEEIRISFKQVRHQSHIAEFYVTFSCGVASLPPCESAIQLNEEADQALYQAKDAGRNRVVLAEESGK